MRDCARLYVANPQLCRALPQMDVFLISSLNRRMVSLTGFAVSRFAIVADVLRKHWNSESLALTALSH